MVMQLGEFPLNTRRVYVRGIARSGCQVFFPVDSEDEEIIRQKQREYQKVLDSQDLFTRTSQ